VAKEREWLARSSSHQTELTAFASRVSVAQASVKAIGPAIIQGHCRLIYFRPTKFLGTASAAAVALFVDGGGPICEAAGGAAECRLNDAALDNK
jgi:hypothetical protein